MKSVWILVPVLSVLAGAARAEQHGPKPRQPAAVPTHTALPPAPLPPSADLCSAPDLIVGTGTFPFDNTTATTGTQAQAQAPCLLFGNTAVLYDVWFVWTAPSSGIATCTTVGLTTVDTKIAAYASPAPGGGCPTSTALACNDDDQVSGTFQSTMSFLVTGGNEYMIQLGCYPGANPPAVPGIGSFSVSISAVLPNDDCSAPTVITGFGPSFPHNYDTTTATTGTQGQNNITCDIFATRNIDSDTWYRWQSTVTGWVRASWCAGATHDSKVAVYAGAGCPTGEPVSCDDDACGAVGGSSEARWLATTGQTYTIQLGSYPGQIGGPGFFTIESFTPAVGDQCSAPILIAGFGPHFFDNTNAVTGLEGQTDVLCTFPGDLNPRITFDLWYQWTSSCTGTATFDLCAGGTIDSKIAAYAGAGCPTGSPLACNDDACGLGGPSAVTIPVTAGQPYMLQLGNWPGSTPTSGSFTVTVSCAPAGTAYCFGDNTGTFCPCSPTPVLPGVSSNGCPNSLYPGGANLASTGTASVLLDSLILRGTGMPNSSCLYFQGTGQQSAGLGAIFGDGLRCVSGSVIRLGTKANASGSSQYPVGADALIHVRGMVPAAGGTRTYQAWYRNAAAFCTTSTFNLTNGVSVAWTP